MPPRISAPFYRPKFKINGPPPPTPQISTLSPPPILWTNNETTKDLTLLAELYRTETWGTRYQFSAPGCLGTFEQLSKDHVHAATVNLDKMSFCVNINETSGVSPTFSAEGQVIFTGGKKLNFLMKKTFALCGWGKRHPYSQSFARCSAPNETVDYLFSRKECPTKRTSPRASLKPFKNVLKPVAAMSASFPAHSRSPLQGACNSHIGTLRCGTARL